MAGAPTPVGTTGTPSTATSANGNPFSFVAPSNVNQYVSTPNIQNTISGTSQYWNGQQNPAGLQNGDQVNGVTSGGGQYTLNLNDFNQDGTAKDPGYLASLGLGGVELDSLKSQASNAWNANNAATAGANQTNNDIQALLAEAQTGQGQLMSNLNSRGLLQSYLSGGMGNTEVNNLQQTLGTALGGDTNSFQNLLNGLNESVNTNQSNLTSVQDSQNKFNQEQQNNGLGLSDFLSMGVKALPLLAAL